jgi:hypothetical protein
MVRPRTVAAALFVNAASSIVGLAGYGLAGQGEAFTKLGYLAFVVWSLAVLPTLLQAASGGAN